MPKNDEITNLSLLYSENAKIAATFWEWRHKLMTSFFTVIAAVVAMASWFYQHSDLKPLIFVPFILAAVYSVLLALMDKVNTKILGECYCVGSDLEQKLSSDGGIFKALQDEKRPSYHKILCAIYYGSAFFCILIAVLTGIFMRCTPANIENGIKLRGNGCMGKPIENRRDDPKKAGLGMHGYVRAVKSGDISPQSKNPAPFNFVARL